MECNREEAIRAKQIAESKMNQKDYAGARKMALKAQKLDPNIDNIPLILAVCDVHCAAEKNLFGNEMDWYGILQVEHTAVEQVVKKQFKRLALQLHPDKNKFGGAEAAFKLIREAQQVLLDSGKRSLHDMKRRIFARPTPTVPIRTPQPQQSYHSNIVKQPTFRTSPPTSSPYKNPPRAVQPETSKPETSKSSPVILEKKEIPNGGTCKVSSFQNGNYSKPINGNGNDEQSVKVEKGTGPDKYKPAKANGKRVSSFQNGNYRKPINGNCNDEQSVKVEEGTGSDKYKPAKANGKRGREEVEESSESFGSDTETENSEDEIFELKRYIRSRYKKKSKSVRKRRQVSCEKYRCNTEKVREGKHAERFVAGDHLASSSGSKETSEQEIYHCPDPDFSDFDKIRNKDCFKAGQMWACYDNKGAMPRFYALIKKVYVDGLRVRIMWLEPDPDDEQIEWTKKELPFSCGKFITGETQTIDNFSTFSHIVEAEEGKSRAAYSIYPRKGETWAIFKNWDIEWINNFDITWKFEFEFVEILSDYNEGDGIFVAYLDKVENFVSIFRRIIKDEVVSFKIPYFELCRFSHKVPSFRMTGRERQDVPKGSFELDPASLPINLVHEVKPVTGINGFPKCQTNEQEMPFVTHEDDNDSSPKKNDDSDSQDAYKTPKSEFYDFDAERSSEMYQVGQVWALYCDYDGLPKWYARISQIDTTRPGLNLRINWFVPLKEQSSALYWADEDMPTCCGKFKLRSGRACLYSDTSVFSHQVRAIEIRTKIFVCSISPNIGEIWALYKKWSVDMKPSELEEICDYDIAEVIQVNDSSVKVAVLQKVKGFNSVFKRQVKQGAFVYDDILHGDQFIRFSHQIPAFKLTKERGGSLKGCWELDPAAVPPVILVSD